MTRHRLRRAGFAPYPWKADPLFAASRAIRLFSIAAFGGVMAVTVLADATGAYAATPSRTELAVGNVDVLTPVINSVRLWLVILLASVATLFLTVGAVRYVLASGDPGEVEKAKSALKSAALGYALALLAPVIVQVIQGLFP